MDTGKVTRLEVINHKDADKFGRQLVEWDKDMSVQLSLQDGGRTLKIFIDRRTPAPEDRP